MSRCPHCHARGCKLADPLAGDYCGHCGKTWPRDLAAQVVSDGQPPPEDENLPLLRFPHVPRPGAAAAFPERVARIAARFKAERWRDQFAVPPEPTDD